MNSLLDRTIADSGRSQPPDCANHTLRRCPVLAGIVGSPDPQPDPRPDPQPDRRPDPQPDRRPGGAGRGLDSAGRIGGHVLVLATLAAAFAAFLAART